MPTNDVRGIKINARIQNKNYLSIPIIVYNFKIILILYQKLRKP